MEQLLIKILRTMSLDGFQYKFISNSRETLPQGCTNRNVQGGNGRCIYYGLKPAEFGSMTIGLKYSYSSCKVDFVGNKTIESLLETL
jgi:hypothetical protein